MQNNLSKNLTSFIWHFLKSYKIPMIIFISLGLCAGLLSPFAGMIIKHIINVLPQVSPSNIEIIVWPAVLLVLNFAIFDNVTWRGMEFIGYKFRLNIKNAILSKTIDYVLGHPFNFFQNNLAGNISKQIQTLADNIEIILFSLSPIFFRGIGLLIFSTITMYFVVSPIFSILIFSWCIIFTFISIMMGRKLVKLTDKYAETESIVSGEIVDSISNNSNIRIFSGRKFEISRLSLFFDLMKQAFQKRDIWAISIFITQGFMISVLLSTALYLLITLYIAKKVTIGDFALILNISMEIAYISWFTMSEIDLLFECVGKCKQSLSTLMIDQNITDKVNATELNIQNGEIKFENVYFNYENSCDIFSNKSVIIKGGQKVGLVGYSGGGKSTFVNLILRFYDINEGKILIDGQDIRDVTQDSLRESISMIPQDPFLFHRSLMDNIRYGKQDATDEEVIEAAKKAYAHDFIITLKDGYNSMVGDRGIKLSGGQRQRIAIARAILKNAPILILDEATSQLDSITETEIQKSLHDLMEKKTTIVIAHRLSTLLNMDRILVFENGKIIQDGAHDKLIEEDGLYKKLWNTQVGGFLVEK